MANTAHQETAVLRRISVLYLFTKSFESLLPQNYAGKMGAVARSKFKSFPLQE